ncbi:MAG TPA: hypothetical protein VNJ51_04520 [Candidatus Dormibacteraeota bacterium]|nr:hypothetical protein [Candidatus Dormibacteraeota bacterium]
MIVEGGSATPEEIAAVVAAIESTVAAPMAAAAPATPPWRIAARLPASDLDAVRRARGAWHLFRRGLR